MKNRKKLQKLQKLKNKSDVTHKSKKNKLLLIILAIIFLLIFVILLMTYNSFQNKILEIKEINISMSVGDGIGINLDKDKLNLGTTMLNGKAQRGMTLDGVENKYVYITSTKNYGKEWVFSDIKMPIKSPLNQLPITIIGKDNNLGYGDYEDTLKIIILKKDLNWLEKMFIKGSILRTQEAAQLKNPEIKIKIVNNSENTLNKTINNSLNIFMNASSQ